MIESLNQSELSTLMAFEKRGLEISVRLKFVSPKVLQLVNKNPYVALSMK